MTAMDPGEASRTIKHGVKMTGMPACGVSMDDESISAITAFVATLPTLSEADYAKLVAASDGHEHGHAGRRWATRTTTTTTWATTT